MHGVGRADDGTIGIVDAFRQPLLQFCVDRRGVWMTVDDAARGVDQPQVERHHVACNKTYGRDGSHCEQRYEDGLADGNYCVAQN